MEFKSFSEAKRCESPWDPPYICVSVSHTYFSSLYLSPALLLRSRVMGSTLSGKPISFSMFLYFYPIMACSEVSKATWRFYWGLIKDLWFNPCNLIEISHEFEALALCVGKWRWCIAAPAFSRIRSGLKGSVWGLIWMLSLFNCQVIKDTAAEWVLSGNLDLHKALLSHTRVLGFCLIFLNWQTGLQNTATQMVSFTRISFCTQSHPFCNCLLAFSLFSFICLSAYKRGWSIFTGCVFVCQRCVCVIEQSVQAASSQ